ncbi:hypothetical protein QCA50_007156 [Cerrena zonata]|uniref:Uncharacterized protein n=1 Tax=Cerrena zonata TaxID=2478898 RepID=A0AAW0GJW8_9APHY
MLDLRSHEDAIATLQSEKVELWHKLLNFARDLQRGPDQPGSGERLEAAIQDPLMRYYFSTAHFSEAEISFLMKFPAPNGETFCDVLEQKLQNTRSEICTSHTFLPIITDFFHTAPNFWKDKSFEKRYKTFEKQWRKRGKAGVH